MTNILFIHGYNGNPCGKSYDLIRDRLDKTKYRLFTLDYDACNPSETIHDISNFCKSNNINIIIGTSLGGFIALNIWDIPKIVHNVCWSPSVELPKIGMDTCDALKYLEFENKILKESGTIEDSISTIGLFTANDQLLGSKYQEIFSKCFSAPIIIEGKHTLDNVSADKIVYELIPQLEIVINAVKHTRGVWENCPIDD